MKTPISKRSYHERGIAKGEHAKYVQGHAKKTTLGSKYAQEDRGHSTECWIWQGTLDKRGYGRVRGESGKVGRAYRVVYEAHVGPIPEGLHLHHHCEVKACVNPDHLEPMTGVEHAAWHDARRK